MRQNQSLTTFVMTRLKHLLYYLETRGIIIHHEDPEARRELVRDHLSRLPARSQHGPLVVAQVHL